MAFTRPPDSQAITRVAQVAQLGSPETSSVNAYISPGASTIELPRVTTRAGFGAGGLGVARMTGGGTTTSGSITSTGTLACGFGSEGISMSTTGPGRAGSSKASPDNAA